MILLLELCLLFSYFCCLYLFFFFFFFNVPSTTEIYTLSLHDALPISIETRRLALICPNPTLSMRRLISAGRDQTRSEEHTSELQSRGHLVCRLLLEKKKK